MKHRDGSAGVTLIEMLVALALFGVLAGMVVLAIPNRSGPLGAEVDAKALAAALNTAVAHTLLTGQGFAVLDGPDGVQIVQRGPDTTWHPHTDQDVARVKLFPDGPRNATNTGSVFEVSSTLIPSRSDPFVAAFGDRAIGTNVVFDGAHAWVTPYAETAN